MIITPNNIPMHAWSSYVPYALASGCPVVVSPSKNDPVCMDAIFKVTKEIVVKFIEVGRLTPANFDETYNRVYETIKKWLKMY